MQQRYVVDVAELHRLNELNYAALLPFVPDEDDSTKAEVIIQAGEGLVFVVKRVDNSRYTTDISIEQLKPSWADYLRAKMTVRLYHDVRMAEVLKTQGITKLEVHYRQPNKDMRHRDEKYQANQFLSDWLQLCRKQGRIQPELSESVQKFMPYYFK
jgi:uncharacterized protein YqiB (DUF1249 family)